MLPDDLFGVLLSLGDGESKSFVMPENNGYPILVAQSGVGAGSTVRGTLVAE